MVAASKKNYVIDKDTGWAKLMTSFKLASSSKEHAEIGFLRSSGMHKMKDGKGNQVQTTVAQIAFDNEFGVPELNIPERPFMRGAIEDNKDKISKFVQKLCGAITDGRITKKKALGFVGQMVSDLIKRKIVAGPFAANAPMTVRLKGSSKPLIDTGQMRQSVDWEITTKKSGSKK